MTLSDAMEILGVELPPLRHDGGDAERLASWKRGALSEAYRAGVRRHHPDLGASHEERARTEATKTLNEARRVLMSVRVHTRSVRPQDHPTWGFIFDED